MRWRTCRLGDVITLKRGHDLPEHSRIEGNIPVVSSSGITGYHKEAKAVAPGVVTGRYGTLGQVFYLEEDYWPLNTALYVVDFKGTHPKFAAYFLRNILKDYQSDKAAVPGIDRNVLHELKVKCPDKAIQQRIATILSTYDDLIENNRRRMALLEDAARQVYQEWFVRLRFPGYEHTRIVDGVPEGWERVSASEIIGVNPKERVESGKEIWYVPMSSLSKAGMTVDISDFESRTSHTAVKFCKDDVLMARITPCLENGKTAFVHFLEDNEIACGSTEFIVLRGQRVSPYFTYCLARSYDFRENAIKSMVGSSGRQRVQTSCFEKFTLGFPPRTLLSPFDDSVKECFEQIANLTFQNQKLRTARDLLLPKLMSGEVSV